MQVGSHTLCPSCLQLIIKGFPIAAFPLNEDENYPHSNEEKRSVTDYIS